MNDLLSKAIGDAAKAIDDADAMEKNQERLVSHLQDEFMHLQDEVRHLQDEVKLSQVYGFIEDSHIQDKLSQLKDKLSQIQVEDGQIQDYGILQVEVRYLQYIVIHFQDSLELISKTLSSIISKSKTCIFKVMILHIYKTLFGKN